MKGNSRLFSVLWIIIAVIGCVCIIMVGITLQGRVKLVSEWNKMFRDLEHKLGILKLPPTTKSIFIMRKDYDWLVKQQKEIWALLETKSLPMDKPTPLEFKEVLLNTEVKLRQLADIQGCQVPEHLGFPEYAGGGIPQTNEVVLLNKQLVVVNEILNLLLKHKVAKIILIEKLPYIYYSEGDLYRELAFRIEVQCVLEDLLGLLADLPKTSFLAVVRSIKLDKVDENRVKAVLIIGVVEFERKK